MSFFCDLRRTVVTTAIAAIELVVMTNTQLRTKEARRYLEKHNRRVDLAIDAYYNEPTQSRAVISSAPSTSKLSSLFDKYKGIIIPLQSNTTANPVYRSSWRQHHDRGNNPTLPRFGSRSRRCRTLVRGLRAQITWDGRVDETRLD